jgi:class 3 adenylate cyclase/tetratricopeptide (TPR) repeat protein
MSPKAKFCSECGRPSKAVTAPRFASPKSYTPQHLADKILTTKDALEGERKQVTVLFADIKGSMEIFADRDPEDVQKLLDPVLEHMMEAVHRYEGTVNRVMGDGIMALFGAPLAHEDHAVRACYAALRMQETVTRYGDEVQRSYGMPVTIRVGLNSGEIVIRAIGNDLHMDYAVVGQTANLAARMEQMAKPGTVLTTADTLRLAEGYVAMSPLGGPMPVKGLADLVQIYEVTGVGAARTRLQASARRGLTRFVGRDSELEQLLNSQQLVEQGRGQVAAIVGEAGVGKSRLVHEFVHSHNAAGWLVLESNSVSYGRATPYLPLIELLKDYFKINVQDSTRLIREKVTSRILTLDSSLQDAIPPVLDLLDVLDGSHPFRSLEPLQHRQHTYRAVTRLLLSESRVQPIIAVFEDLHWNDSLTLGLLNEMVVGSQNARLLLLVTYRPDFRDEWRHRPNYLQLSISPLASESLTELLQAVLGSDPSLQTLESFLVERASGNPFFVEEIVRTLVDTGVLEGRRGSYYLVRPLSSIEVPRTVQAVLAARIDALPAAGKRLLQEAAIIGRDVPFVLLHAICGLTEDELRSQLDALEAAEFLYATQLFPNLQYTFKHALTHEVTYSEVLHERRRDIHVRVVDATEKLYVDRLGEQAERLAYHAVGAALHEKAVHYLRQAGGRAAARSALLDARAWFEQAMGVLKKLPESQAALEQAFDVRLELRPVLRLLGEGRQMLEHLREAEAIAERLKDDSRRGLACAFMTTVQSSLDELDEALVTGKRALEIAQRLGDSKLLMLTTAYLEQTHYYRGEYEQVVDLATDNVTLLPVDWIQEYVGMSVPASVFGRAFLIMSLAEVGRFAEAAKYETEAIQLAEPTQHAHTVSWAYLPASILHLTKGDWAKALSRVEKWIATLEAGNVAVQLPWAISSSAWALAQLGDAGEALKRIREGEQLLERQTSGGIVAHRSWAYQAVGRACLLLGRLDDARRLGNHAVETSRRQPGFAAHALRLLGDIASHPDRFDAETSLAQYREALALAQAHGMRSLVAHSHLGLSRLYRRTGQPERARESLTKAMTMYGAMDMSFWVKQAEADMVSSADVGPHVRPAAEIRPVLEAP